MKAIEEIAFSKVNKIQEKKQLKMAQPPPILGKPPSKIDWNLKYQYPKKIKTSAGAKIINSGSGLMNFGEEEEYDSMKPMNMNDHH